MSIRNINTLPLAALLIMVGIASASTASANAGHNNVVGPDVRDAGMVRGAPAADAGTCFTEPTGFHSNIHWDNACHDAQKADRMSNRNTDSAKSKYVEPSGFHTNVRSR